MLNTQVQVYKYRILYFINVKNKCIKYCLNCGKKIQKGKFCSQSCAATYSNHRRKLSEETRSKISNTLTKKLEIAAKDNYEKYIRICVICGNKYSVYRGPKNRPSKSKTCSTECHKILISRVSSETFKKLKSEGRFQGWKSRNIISYAEKFWTTVLSNNKIEYVREKKIGKYFIDFYIEVNGKIIDLEIDGKQHKYKERADNDIERDKYLTNVGILVYRIEWNPINNEEGKEKMKNKIDLFLDFYHKL